LLKRVLLYDWLGRAAMLSPLCSASPAPWLLWQYFFVIKHTLLVVYLLLTPLNLRQSFFKTQWASGSLTESRVLNFLSLVLLCQVGTVRAITELSTLTKTIFNLGQSITHSPCVVPPILDQCFSGPLSFCRNQNVHAVENAHHASPRILTRTVNPKWATLPLSDTTLHQ
jgi:hypothetical protein